MTVAIDPAGGFIKEEEQPPEHNWSQMSLICTKCGMTMSYFVDTDTPCKDLPYSP